MTKIAVAGATGRVGRHVVEVLEAQGHEVVPMSRASGVDVTTGDGLAEALAGVEVIVDCATGPSPDEQEATDFFTKASSNLQAEGERAGVQRMVVVSIIGIDRFTTGYNAAKVAHERATLAGAIPSTIVRAAQFHEFVGQIVEWGTQGDVSYVPRARTQLVAARTVAETLAEHATASEFAAGATTEVAGPREEDMFAAAELLVARRGLSLRLEEGTFPADEDGLYEQGALLPGPDAKLAGPTFEEWLDSPDASRG
jgi:uncharacterized protein YbjT (DUF2867 family)